MQISIANFNKNSQTADPITGQRRMSRASTAKVYGDARFDFSQNDEEMAEEQN